MRLVVNCALAGVLCAACIGLSLPSTTENAGDVTIAPASCDLGAVTEAVYCTGTTLENHSQHPVRIIAVKTSCSCFDSQYPDSWIAPQASAQIECKWDLRGKAGHTDALLEIIVECNGPSGAEHLPPLMLLLDADVQLQWWAAPKNVSFEADEPGKKRVTLQSREGGLPVRIISCESSDNALTVFIAPDRTSVDVHFNPTAWQRHGPAHITFVTDCEAAPLKRVGVWILEDPSTDVAGGPSRHEAESTRQPKGDEEI